MGEYKPVSMSPEIKPVVPGPGFRLSKIVSFRFLSQKTSAIGLFFWIPPIYIHVTFKFRKRTYWPSNKRSWLWLENGWGYPQPTSHFWTTADNPIPNIGAILSPKTRFPTYMLKQIILGTQYLLYFSSFWSSDLFVQGPCVRAKASLVTQQLPAASLDISLWLHRWYWTHERWTHLQLLLL